MSTLYIRNVPDDLLNDLDNIAERMGKTRNQLVVEALNLYAATQDEKLHKMLPMIVRSEIKEEVKRFESSIKDTLNMLLIAALRVSKTNEKLNNFLFPELEKLNIDGMNSEEILAIINSDPDQNDEKIIAEMLKNDEDFD